MFRKSKKSSLLETCESFSLIAENVEIVGNVTFSAGLRIDGRLRGEVLGQAGDAKQSSLLVLTDKGHIEGKVSCHDALINGTVVGDIDVENRLELQSEARVSGTIRYRSLQVEFGAVIDGSMIKVDPQTGNVLGIDHEVPARTIKRVLA